MLSASPVETAAVVVLGVPVAPVGELKSLPVTIPSGCALEVLENLADRGPPFEWGNGLRVSEQADTTRWCVLDKFCGCQIFCEGDGYVGGSDLSH